MVRPFLLHALILFALLITFASHFTTILSIRNWPRIFGAKSLPDRDLIKSILLLRVVHLKIYPKYVICYVVNSWVNSHIKVYLIHPGIQIESMRVWSMHYCYGRQFFIRRDFRIFFGSSIQIFNNCLVET